MGTHLGLRNNVRRKLAAIPVSALLTLLVLLVLLVLLCWLVPFRGSLADASLLALPLAGLPADGAPVDPLADGLNSDALAIHLFELGGAAVLVVLTSRVPAGILVGLRLAVALEPVEGVELEVLVLAGLKQPLAVEDDVALVLDLLVDATVAVSRPLLAGEAQHTVLDV